MKRVVSSSIISVVILLMIAGGFFYYQYYRGVNATAFETVPADVAWLVSCDPSSGELRQLAKTGFFNGHDSIPVLHEWYNTLISFDSLVVNTPELKSIFSENPLVVSGHVTGPGNFSLLFISKLSGSNPDGLADRITRKIIGVAAEAQTRNYNGVEIREVNFTDSKQIFSWAVTKGVFVGSFTSYLVEDAIRQQRSIKFPSPATRLQSFVEGKDRGLLAAIKYSGFQRWVNTQINSSANVSLNPLQRVGDWTIVNLNLHPNIISFQGTTLYNDSLEFIELFREQKPVTSRVIQLLPSRTAAAIIWGMSDSKLFMDDLGVYLNKQTERKPEFAGDRASIINYFKPWIGEEVALLVTKPVSSGLDNHYFALIAVNNEKLCNSSLINFAKNIKTKDNSADAEELYNGYTIRYLSLQGILPSLFGPLFNHVYKFFYTIVEGHLIVANQASSLRGFINDVRTKNFLVNDERYHAMESDIPKQINLLFYCSIPQSEEIFKSVAVPKWVNWLSKYGESLKGWNGLSFVISNQQGVFNSKGCLSYFNSGAKGPHLVWNSKLDTTLTKGPFIPGDKNKLILAQDSKMQLYALDFEGNVRWKKNLDSQLKGEIQAVDYYQNGSEQYVLSTSSFIYMIDSLGMNVGNYPIRLPAAASNGIAAIKYDSTKTNTQLFIACMNLRLYGYELTGKPISGFSTVKLPDIIYLPVRLISTPTYKYLSIIDQNGTCFLVDKFGDRKFTLKEKLNLLDGEILPASDSSQLFRWIDNRGVVYSSGFTGEVKEELNLDVDSLTGAVQSDVNGDGQSDWIITSRTGIQVETSDKIVLYRYRTDDKVTKPSIFTHGGKTYILFSSPDSGKFYLFNRDGTLYEGFPQAGIQTPIYVKSGAGSTMSFVVKGDENSINFYQID